MNDKKLFRNLAAFAALVTVTGVVTTSAVAQDKKPFNKIDNSPYAVWIEVQTD